MDLGLKGRVAVITGPAKGMGAAVSKAFAAEGCKLALIGRDTSAIEPVAKDIRAVHHGVTVELQHFRQSEKRGIQIHRF